MTTSSATFCLSCLSRDERPLFIKGFPGLKTTDHSLSKILPTVNYSTASSLIMFATKMQCSENVVLTVQAMVVLLLDWLLLSLVFLEKDLLQLLKPSKKEDDLKRLKGISLHGEPIVRQHEL